jgi:hypothetical protein
MMDKVGLNKRITESPVVFSLLLAFMLLGIVCVLNWLGSSEMPLTEEQFSALLEQGGIRRIEVSHVGLHCQLDQKTRLDERGREFSAGEGFLALNSPVATEEVERWEAAGITVSRHEGSRSSPLQGWGGGLLVVGLLGVGLWHLWSQVKEDREGNGSPRRRLKALEDDLDNEKISPEEFRKKAEVIWAEL